jgi:hypothetical protein
VGWRREKWVLEVVEIRRIQNKGGIDATLVAPDVQRFVKCFIPHCGAFQRPPVVEWLRLE